MIVWQLVLFIVALIVLIEGSNFFIDHVARLAKLFKVSDFIIGLTIVAIGTSLPELASSISAALQNQTGLIIGNIIGSNIANIGLIIGVAAVFSVLSVKERVFHREGMFLLIISLLFFLFSLDLQIQWYEGIIFLFIFVSYIFYLREYEQLSQLKGRGIIYKYLSFGKIVTKHTIHGIRKGLSYKSYKKLFDGHREVKIIDYASLCFYSFIGLLIILISSYLVIFAAGEIVTYYQISSTIIGLTLIAIGTSLPELAVAIAAARKKKADIIIGTVLGSNIYNILIVIGVSAIISPLVIIELSIWYALPAMLLTTASLLYFIRKHWIIRAREGLILLSIYITFLLGLIFWV